MKNLANCKPSEFLKQTYRIKESAKKWLEVTDIMNIRRHQPSYTEDMTDEQKKKELDKTAINNLNEILDAIMVKHPDETLELLALMCFVEPEDVDKYTVSEYLGAFNEIINDKNVLGFIRSLMELDQMAG